MGRFLYGFNINEMKFYSCPLSIPGHDFSGFPDLFPVSLLLDPTNAAKYPSFRYSGFASVASALHPGCPVYFT